MPQLRAAPPCLGTFPMANTSVVATTGSTLVTSSGPAAALPLVMTVSGALRDDDPGELSVPVLPKKATLGPTTRLTSAPAPAAVPVSPTPRRPAMKIGYHR